MPPARVLKWFIDACQRGTRVWLITTVGQYAERMALRWRCCYLLTTSISSLSSQQSKWKEGLKSIGMLQRRETIMIITHQMLDEKWRDSFAILRLLQSVGQKCQSQKGFVAMDTTSSKMLTTSVSKFQSKCNANLTKFPRKWQKKMRVNARFHPQLSWEY